MREKYANYFTVAQKRIRSTYSFLYVKKVVQLSGTDAKHKHNYKHKKKKKKVVSFVQAAPLTHDPILAVNCRA